MEQYREWRRELVEDASFAPCPRCRAEREVAHIRTSTNAFANWLLADPLVELEYTDPVALAKAEGARYAVLQSLLSLTSSGVQSAMRPATAGALPHLLLHGIQALFPEDAWRPRGSQHGATVVAAELLRRSKEVVESGYALDFAILPPSSTHPNSILAVWLRLRDIWMRWNRLHVRGNAEYWSQISDDVEAVAYFHASSESLGISNASRIFAATITCEISDWETAEAAWDFYQRLVDPRIGAVFETTNWHQQSLRMQEAVETAAVAAALGS